MVPFVRDTLVSRTNGTILPNICINVSRTNGTILPNIFNHSSFLSKALHSPDWAQWKLSRDMMLDDINPFLGYLKKNIFQNVPYITRNRPLSYFATFGSEETTSMTSLTFSSALNPIEQLIAILSWKGESMKQWCNFPQWIPYGKASQYQGVL